MQWLLRGLEPCKIIHCIKAIADSLLLQDLALHLPVENKMQNASTGRN